MTTKLLLTALLFVIIAGSGIVVFAGTTRHTSRPTRRAFTVESIGMIQKTGSSTKIRIDKDFQDGLQGLDGFSHVWVFWWFDRNDNPGQRRILQVHPRGDAKNPLTGVFATRAPVRPNLIALSLCRIKNVKDNVIELDKIDAFDRTPVLDLKPYFPVIDHAEKCSLPDWAKSKE